MSGKEPCAHDSGACMLLYPQLQVQSSPLRQHALPGWGQGLEKREISYVFHVSRGGLQIAGLMCVKVYGSVAEFKLRHILLRRHTPKVAQQLPEKD